MQKHGMLSDLPVSMYRYSTNSYLFSGFYQQLMTHIYNMTATITPLGKTLMSNTIPIENHASIS